MKAPAVYILASQRKGTLYIGVTSNLIQRIWQHREGLVEGFTRQYGVKTLVWYEQHESMESAIAREKTLKKWNRDWKLRLIEKRNPQWLDLWPEITGEVPLDNSTTSPSSFPSVSIGNPLSTPQSPPSAPSSLSKPSALPTSSTLPTPPALTTPSALPRPSSLPSPSSPSAPSSPNASIGDPALTPPHSNRGQPLHGNVEVVGKGDSA